MAIELDDNSHNLEERKQRDGFVEKVLEKAGIPLLRIKMRKGGYGVGEIKTLIKKAISIKGEIKP